MDRRTFLAGSISTTMALPLVAAAKPTSFRIAHLTDVHLQPELHAVEGFTKCLRHVQAAKAVPELILFGGDLVMDAFEATRTRTELQWKLWHQVLKTECNIRTEACIGNHDIFGWNKAKSNTTGNEPDYGKKWAIDALKLSGRYSSFDFKGWHFIVLDSVQPGAKEGTYSAYLDEEQWDWFTKDLLANKNKHTLVYSHIPMVTAMPLLDPRKLLTDPLSVTAGACHTDSRKLVELFRSHPQVKLCLSGHIHQLEKVQYNGLTYICGGAVSANWWRGPLLKMPEGYLTLDLYDDGTFKHEYNAYGWEAKKS